MKMQSFKSNLRFSNIKSLFSCSKVSQNLIFNALEMMKQGVKRLLVPKSLIWRGMGKRFSILYNGKWLKNIDKSNGNITNSAANNNRPSSSSATIIRDKFCCLSREDVIHFLTSCLGSSPSLLSPLSSISSLGAINPNFCSVETSRLAIEVTQKLPQEPSAVVVVEPISDGQYIIIGEISASKLWKCDYLANCSMGSSLVMGVEDNPTSRSAPDFSINPTVGSTNFVNGGGSTRPMKFGSRNIGFFSNPACPSFGVGRSMYRGRSAPLTCKVTSSLAAGMA